MKKFFLLTILSFLSTFVMSQEQTINNVDTTVVCIPVEVVSQIVLDLNELDRLKKITEIQEKEINELNNKVEVYENLVETLEVKDSLNVIIIGQIEEKVEIYADENKRLRKENDKIKRTNKVITFISTSVIIPLTYIILFK